MSKHYIAVMLMGVALVSSTLASRADTVAISKARAAAIHECSVLAGRYPETTFSSLEFELYRACMAQRGQVE